MARTDILICPGCDYKRRLTDAESIISHALVVSCLKCGTAMQCTSENNGKPPEKPKTFLESCALEAMEEWAVT